MDKPTPDRDARATTPRATRRPPGVSAPAHWTSSPPPAPRTVTYEGRAEKGRPDPVRYGDWEKKGIAIDF